MGKWLFLFKSLLRSRSIKRLHPLEIGENDEQTLEALEGVLSVNSFDYLMAAGTNATNFLSRCKARLAEITCPVVEDYSKLWRIHNKVKCMELAHELGLPMPETHVIRTMEDLRAAAREINYPVVVKFPESSGSLGLWTHPYGGKSLIEQYLSRHPELVDGEVRDGLPIIQKRVDGKIFDVTAFAVDGAPVGLLTQERVVTSWLNGGGGLVNVTNRIPELQEAAGKILSALEWTGPMQIEWIWDDQNQRYCFLEINPKFFGTTQLSITAGYDYPAWALAAAMGEPIHAPDDYEEGVGYRWLMQELWTVMTMPQNRQSLKKELAGFFQRFSWPHCKADFVIQDWRPYVREVLEFMSRFFWRGGISKTFRAFFTVETSNSSRVGHDADCIRFR